MARSPYHFDVAAHEPELVAIIDEIGACQDFDPGRLQQILRRHPKNGDGLFSKGEIVHGYRQLAERHDWPHEAYFLQRLRMKPVRTQSGVAPVTVLTKPYPCPGRCIFCPSDVRMPKSYLSNEPGAQRAAQHSFDPYLQTASRLRSLYNIGHPVDKVELIVLGGTWSFYPEEYQIWFVKRCFDALNDFSPEKGAALEPSTTTVDFQELQEQVEGRAPARSFNQVVSDFLRSRLDGRLLASGETAEWNQLLSAQKRNERAASRCVGLVLETRPDHLPQEEVERLRRLGATKVQIGLQSLSDRVLALNRRGHDVAASRRAMALLRRAGFKIHAHWMPNLYGSSPAEDVEDFGRLFADPAFRPDELKIYPCSLIESAELMSVYEAGDWRPYHRRELMEVLVGCLEQVPPYCRVTRMIRDIPSHDIVAGNKETNFRQVVEAALARRGRRSGDIRSREIRDDGFGDRNLRLAPVEYDTSVSREVFLQYVAGHDRLVAFLRLSLPQEPSCLSELGRSALLREVHVYGNLAGLGERSRGRPQHSGLGTRLVREAARRARAAGYSDLVVISSVGTREYYRRLGFTDGSLYQHLRLIH